MLKRCLLRFSRCAPTLVAGDVWHVQLQGLPLSGIAYGYRVAGEGGWEQGHRWDAGRVLLDPYAPLVNGRRVFGQRDELEAFKPKLGSTWLGTYDLASKPFDWGNGQEEVARPQHELKVRAPVPCTSPRLKRTCGGQPRAPAAAWPAQC